jgi:hypothetical protein
MNTTSRLFAGALLSVAALCASTVCQAQSPFDGTWRVDFSQSKLSQKPNSFYIAQGWYHCDTCTPSFVVPADGQDHPVTGQAYDTLSVNASDPHSITLVGKKDGATMFEQTRTVSANGKILTIKSTSHPKDSDKPVTAEVTAKLVGVAPMGVHATSGNWQVLNVKTSENNLIFTYKSNGDEITMTDPTGQSYTAKFDGADYPVKGTYSNNTVSLKRINDHTIEETDKRDGTVTDVSTMTVSPNGKTMTIVDNDKRANTTDTLIAKKQ